MASALPVDLPAPVGPGDPEAWYAEAVNVQYPVFPGVVATVEEDEDGFHYRTREPMLTAAGRTAFERIRDFVGDTHRSRPRTRADAVERMRSGLTPRWQRQLDSRADLSPASRRRVAYYVAARLRALGDLTPLALDDRIRIADASGDRVVVHTREFAPVETDVRPESPYLDRFLRDRLASYSVAFEGFSIPVAVFRRRLLGADAFDRQYAVAEPEQFPGDGALIEETKRRIRQSPPDSVLDDAFAAVETRARTLLRRRVGLGGDALIRRMRRRVGDWLPGVDSPPDPTTPARSERVDDLAYYVLRDLVGDGPLTVPIRDPKLRAVEANRVGERVKVVGRADAFDGVGRMPSTVSIDDERTFVRLVRTLAAEGGLELSNRREAGTVELQRDTGKNQRRLQCAVGLPAVSDDGPYISIRSTPGQPPTPIELLERGRLSSTIVAAVWTAAEAKGAVLFLGPIEADPTLVMSAHTPFIPAEARPVSVAGGGSTVEVPHETGISLRTTRGSSTTETVDRSAAERDALHPDVEIIPDVTAGDGFTRLSAGLGSGRGLLAAAKATDRPLFAERARENGVAPALLGNIDLVVSLTGRDGGSSASLWIPRVSPKPQGSEPAAPERETGPTVGRSATGRLEWEPGPGTATGGTDSTGSSPFVDRLADRTNRDATALEAAFERRRRYVESLHRSGRTERADLLGFLADLRTDEAATIERLQRVLES